MRFLYNAPPNCPVEKRSAVFVLIVAEELFVFCLAFSSPRHYENVSGDLSKEVYDKNTSFYMGKRQPLLRKRTLPKR